MLLKNLLSLFLLLLFFCVPPASAQDVVCQDCPRYFGESEYQGIIMSQIEVQTNQPYTLSELPLTEVYINLTHDWMSDIFVVLRSPDGTTYFLMGDDDNNIGGCNYATSANDMDVYFVQGDFGPISYDEPYDCFNSNFNCFSGFYTLGCPSSYYFSDLIPEAEAAPNCDLDDFNATGGPANGVWTLFVGCVCGETANAFNSVLIDWGLSFGDGTITNIYGQMPECVSNVGNLFNSNETYFDCATFQEHNGQIRLGNINYSSQYPYSFQYFSATNILFKDDVVFDFAGSFITVAPPNGVYEQKQFVYRSEYNSILPGLLGMHKDDIDDWMEELGVCLSWAEGDYTFTVDLDPEEFSDVAAVCGDDCIIYGNQLICDTGQYEVIIPPSTTYPCGAKIDLTVRDDQEEMALLSPSPSFVCPGEKIELLATGGSNYAWFSPQGDLLSESSSLNLTEIETPEVTTYSVMITHESGCSTTQAITLSSMCTEESQDLFIGESITYCFDEWTNTPSGWCDNEASSLSLNVEQNCVTVTALEQGEASLCLYVIEDNLPVYKRINIRGVLNTSLAEALPADWRIYPNPATTDFFLSQVEAQKLTLILRAIDGRIIRQYQQTDIQAQHALNDVTTGVYVLECITAQKHYYHKIVVTD